MAYVVEIASDHLKKWKALGEYVSERPEVKAFGISDDGVVCGVMLVSESEIHHIYVPEESQRGGYGTTLLKYALNVIRKGSRMRCAVDQDNWKAVRLLTGSNFRIVGFRMCEGDNRYVFEYDAKWEPSRKHPLADVKAELEDMTDKMYVAEALPIVL